MPDPPSASIMAATDAYRCPVRAVGTYAGTTDGYKEGKLDRRKTTSGGEGVEVIPPYSTYYLIGATCFSMKKRRKTTVTRRKFVSAGDPKNSMSTSS